MYEDQIDPYEAEMEARHAWLDERDLALGEIDTTEADEAEADYWIAEQEAEIEAERRNEEALYGGGDYEDDPQERELWAIDPQINGDYDSMPQISVAEANAEVAAMIAARDEDLPF